MLSEFERTSSWNGESVELIFLSQSIGKEYNFDIFLYFNNKLLTGHPKFTKRLNYIHLIRDLCYLVEYEADKCYMEHKRTSNTKKTDLFYTKK